VAFDPVLARRVYAASDFFVVPSRYEPCGLTQMHAMRYGSIPIVTAVGGLCDTVVPLAIAQERGTGLVAAAPTRDELLVALDDALTLYADPLSRAQAIGRAMARDSSWPASADAYFRLYDELVTARGG
jgi:starch synthase